MHRQNDRQYYIARREASLNLAARANDPAVAAVHAELALRYAMLSTETDIQVGLNKTIFQPT